MAKGTEEDGTEDKRLVGIKEPEREQNSKLKVLEEISYCLSVAKRLIDIELGRIPQ